MWICNPYLFPHVCRPCRTWGWKIWQRYRFQYRFGQISKRKNFICHNYCKIYCSGPKSQSSPSKKDRRTPKLKLKSKVKTKLKSRTKQSIACPSSFQSNLEAIVRVCPKCTTSDQKGKEIAGSMSKEAPYGLLNQLSKIEALNNRPQHQIDGDAKSYRNRCLCLSSLKQTGFSRPSTSHGGNGRPQEPDLRITKIVPQPRPKQPTREKCTRDEHKTKRGRSGLLDNCEAPCKLEDMTPTKLEQNNSPPSAIIKPESVSTNYCPRTEAFGFPESQYNNLLYLLPIKQFPETGTKMQVFIVDLDPMASRYLKPNKEEAAGLVDVDVMRPEQDESWKGGRPDSKASTKKKCRNTFKSRKENLEPNEGGKNRHKSNRDAKMKKTEDGSIQTEISIFSPEILDYNLNHYPSFETFTIEDETTSDVACQTEISEDMLRTAPARKKKCVTFKTTDSSNSAAYGKRYFNENVHSKSTWRKSSNFGSQTYPDPENKIKNRSRSKSLIDTALFEPKDFVYTKYLNLDHPKTPFQAEFGGPAAATSTRREKLLYEEDKSAQTMIHPNPLYMVYYESNVYGKDKKQSSVQTDFNCLCDEAKTNREVQNNFVRCPYLPLQDQFNQTANEYGDYLVPEYVIAEDQSSQTVNRACCKCFPPKDSTEERFVQNKICQYNEPIHKAIEYNKNEYAYFKTYKSGITKVASTSVEEENIRKVAASSFSCTCSPPEVYKSCTCTTSTSSSITCFCKGDECVSRRDDRVKMDAATASSTFSHWGTTNSTKSRTFSKSSTHGECKKNTETKVAATSISSIHSKFSPKPSHLSQEKYGTSKTSQCDYPLEKSSETRGMFETALCTCCQCSAQEPPALNETAEEINPGEVSVNQTGLDESENVPSITSKDAESEILIATEAPFDGQTQAPNFPDGCLMETVESDKSCHKLVQTDMPNYGTFVQMHEMGNGADQCFCCDCSEEKGESVIGEQFKLGPPKTVQNPKSQLSYEKFTTRRILHLDICDYNLGGESGSKDQGEFQVIANSLSGVRSSQNTITQLDNFDLENGAERRSGQRTPEAHVPCKRAKSV